MKINNNKLFGRERVGDGESAIICTGVVVDWLSLLERLLLAEVSSVGEGLRPQGPAVAVVVVVVLYDGRGVVGQVHDLVVEHLGLGDLEDDHGGGEDDAEETQGERLPRLERDERQRQRHQRAHLELEPQQEGDDDLAQHAASPSS